MALGAGDCERLHDGLIAQPVSTASALTYVAVGAWLAGRGRRRDQGGMVAFGLAVAAAGIGSVDYHGPGSPAARLLHDGSLYLVTDVAGGKVVLDANHPLAGMALRFTLEVLAVRTAKPEEIAQGVSLP